MVKLLNKLAIRPEDILAVLMIIPSLLAARQSEYYYFLNGNIVFSKHTSGLLLLLILSILTALYENRTQRIIDTIKSGSVTFTTAFSPVESILVPSSL